MVFNFNKSVIRDELKGMKLALTALLECKSDVDEIIILIDMGERIFKLIFQPINKYIDDNRIETIGLSLEEYDKINEFQLKTLKLLQSL